MTGPGESRVVEVAGSLEGGVEPCGGEVGHDAAAARDAGDLQLGGDEVGVPDDAALEPLALQVDIPQVRPVDEAGFRTRSALAARLSMATRLGHVSVSP